MCSPGVPGHHTQDDRAQGNVVVPAPPGGKFVNSTIFCLFADQIFYDFDYADPIFFSFDIADLLSENEDSTVISKL